MSKALSIKTSQAPIFLRILSGPNKGARFEILNTPVTIGRDIRNDVHLRDNAVSRNHLQLDRTPNGFLLTNLSQKNPIVFRKKSVRHLEIPSGENFQIGKSKILIESQPLTTSVPQKPLLKTQNKPSGKVLFYTISGVGLLILIFFLSSIETTPKALPQERSLASPANESSLAQTNRQLSRQVNKLKTTNHTEAQSQYIRGFRNYQRGQYKRSASLFRGCLSLESQHKLCSHYLRLSLINFNRSIQSQMRDGKIYVETKQYSACANIFRNIIVMINNPRDKVYQEAKTNYDFCRRKHILGDL